MVTCKLMMQLGLPSSTIATSRCSGLSARADGSYTQDYSADQLVGKIQEDPLFSDQQKISKKGGADVYVRAADRNPMAKMFARPEFKSRGEAQAGGTINELLAFSRERGRDKRVRTVPAVPEQTGMVGFLGLTFNVTNAAGELEQRSMAGTGLMYQRIGEDVCAIISPAHNFI